jgi:hypothetical protein
VKALDPKKEQVYVVKSDRALPDAEQVKWYFVPLSYRDRVDLQDSIVVTLSDRNTADQAQTIVKSGTQQKKVLLACVVKVEGLKDESGTEVEYPTGNNDSRKMEFWSRIPPEFTKEIADYILGLAEPKEAEAKN